MAALVCLDIAPELQKFRLDHKNARGRSNSSCRAKGGGQASAAGDATCGTKRPLIRCPGPDQGHESQAWGGLQAGMNRQYLSQASERGQSDMGEAAGRFSDSDGSFAPHALHSGPARLKIRWQSPTTIRLPRGRNPADLVQVQGERHRSSPTLRQLL